MKKTDSEKKGTAKKKSSRGMGWLYKRSGGKQYPADSTVNAPYWLQYNVPNPSGEGTGKCVRVPLRDTKGTPITNREQAEAERMRVMAPFIARDEAEAQRQLLARLNTAEETLRIADDAANPPLAISAAWAEFKTSPGRPDCGNRTLSGYENHFKRFSEWIAKEHPAVVALRDVTPTHASAYAKNLTGEHVTASTFNQHIGLLRLAWKVLANEARTGGVNPWGNTPKDGIARLKLHSLANRKRALTAEQFSAVYTAASADPDLQDLLAVLAWTGQRLVDVVKLRWEAVNFLGRVITLYPQKTARRTGKAVHIPIFPALLEVLNRRHSAMAHTAAEAYVFPILVKEYDGSGLHRENLHRRCTLAQHAAGASLSKRISDVLDAAKIQTTVKRDDLDRSVVLYGAHSFRHLFVTAAASAGLPAAMIKSITGHSSDAMSEHYQQFDAKLAGEFAKRLTGKEPTALPSGRDPLPAWARELIEGMTAKTWKTIKTALLQG